jgi:PhnB protein
MQGVPEGFHTLTTYLFVKNAANAIEFYKKAFSATELLRLVKPNGQILHSEIQIGDSQMMVADEVQEPSKPKTPLVRTNLPFGIHMYVADPDAVIDQAVKAGAKLVDAAKDTDDGERRGGVEDPFGFMWWISTQRIVNSRPEIQRQFDAQKKS